MGDRQGLSFGSLKRNLPSKHHVAFRQRRGRHEAEARDKNAVIRYFEHIGVGAISNAVKVASGAAHDLEPSVSVRLIALRGRKPGT